jgi:hypothetical protein
MNGGVREIQVKAVRSVAELFGGCMAPLLAIFLLVAGSLQAEAQGKEVFGYVERVQIREADFPMLAKLDTGADTSSIHGRHVKEYQKEGVPWVHFEIRNFQGKVSDIEAPVVRVAKIKRHSGPAQRRVVIKLGLCLGEMFQEEYVSIVDRSRFEYQFLLGRSFLAGNAIVDPSSMFTSSPSCKHFVKSAPHEEPSPSPTAPSARGDVREKEKEPNKSDKKESP